MPVSRRPHRTPRLVGLLVLLLATTSASAGPRPNVLLIVCDDLNDWVEPLGGHPQARTPALARLAREGVTFTNAHSNNPVCAPSRASFLTGVYPHTSGNLFWAKWFENPVLASTGTIMRRFRESGYRVVGSGKLMHHPKRDEWDEFPHEADYGPVAWDGQRRVAHPDVPEPFRSIGAIDGSFGPLERVPFSDGTGAPGAGWINGGWKNVRPFRVDGPDDRDPTPDERVAAWAAQRIERFAADDDGPFFLAVGFIRPHTPMHAPRAFFDLFPPDEIRLPAWMETDADDTRLAAHVGPDQKGRRYFRMISEAYGTPDAGLRHFAQAYLACTTFVDAQIGVVLDALDRSGLADDTIVIVTSDHGFTMGDNAYLFKNSPWESSTRVPLLIRAPGLTTAGGRADVPVGLIAIAPTLVDLCGLDEARDADPARNADPAGKADHAAAGGRRLDGVSLRPLLADPAAGAWDGPPAALTMVHAAEDAARPLTELQSRDPAHQHWSIRTATHRYIRYNSGQVELYDHRTDPHERRNIADGPEAAPVVSELDALLRRLIAPVVLPAAARDEPAPEARP